VRILTRPEVFLISRPQIDTRAMLGYLREVGGTAWFKRVFHDRGDPMGHDIPAAEGLIEFMGRLCYKSWEPGLNKNITKVREDRQDYLLNILRSAHGSVLEHAFFSFVIRGGSRVFTAEMNRHRAGVAISEQSLRYVRLDAIEFWLPSGLSDATENDMIAAVNFLEKTIKGIYEREFTPDMSFQQKKELTSKIRRIAPLGLATEEGWTANVRTIRHVLEMRTDFFAEEEIRLIVGDIGHIMQLECPLLFDDYSIENGQWDTEYRKV
jgi:thymidylate synthase (FAD)